MHTQSLNGQWELCRGGLELAGSEGLDWVRGRTQGWMVATVPGEIHLDLMEAGEMREPLVADRAPASRWPEEHAWWYRCIFTVDDAIRRHERQTLVCDGIDLYGQLFLNGHFLGESRNAHLPAHFDVRTALRGGENELIVRVTCGTELVPAEVPRQKRFAPPDATSHRSWREGIRHLRKAQFSYGWDWVDALPNIGIWRGVRLEARSGILLHDPRIRTRIVGERASLDVEVEMDNPHPVSEREREIAVTVTSPEGEQLWKRLPVIAPSGLSVATVTIEIPHARLWWPNGMGAQPLYEVRVELLDGETVNDRCARRIGLRTVTLDRSPLPEGSRFCLKVNGEDVFCKGGNWIPADALMARVDRGHVERLVEAARAANFTMLRVWGGGIFESEPFYEACDRAGILVWQDFLFACNVYPDREPSFLEGLRAEAEAAIRRLRHHPSLALWCGNNENHWGFTWTVGKADAFDNHGMALGGIRSYNYLLPELCRHLDPDRPYWPSSPYGGEEPNSELSGDCHWWMPFTMNKEMERRIHHEVFDECRSRFVSEYGVIGPCHLNSVRAYLESDKPDRQSLAWQMHTNTFEKETVPAGIRCHYADPEKLDLADYLLYGQMLQAMLYGQTLEALRFRKHDPIDDCQGALIWMYNDCWGETGWTPIDYYHRRKASYYWIKRAFLPIHCIVRRRGHELVTRIVNDTRRDADGQMQVGWWRLDGRDRWLERHTVHIPANGMIEVTRAAIPAADAVDPRQWIYGAILEGDELPVSQSIWKLRPHRELQLSEPDVTVSRAGDRITLSSHVYCHGLHAEDGGRGLLSDNYIDLLPGHPVIVQVLHEGKLGPFRAIAPAAHNGQPTSEEPHA